MRTTLQLIAVVLLALSAVAIVRHASTGRSGFEFLGLTPEERQQIASVMSSK